MEFNLKSPMKQYAVYAVWLAFTIAWNFGYPIATPLEDVLAAIVFMVFTKIVFRYWVK